MRSCSVVRTAQLVQCQCVRLLKVVKAFESGRRATPGTTAAFFVENTRVGTMILISCTNPHHSTASDEHDGAGSSSAAVHNS